MTAQTVSFTAMADGTREEYHMLRALSEANPVDAAAHILSLFRAITGHGEGYRIDRHQHALQTATRAMRDHADEEMVVVALLHDVGDLIGPENHAAVGAEILRPYVSEDNYWLVRHHGVFQGYYYFHHFDQDRDARERYRGHAMFERTAEFCEKWDQPSFDPDYDTAPLEELEPMVRRVFARRREHFI
jgi:predicted HD phosphohydrolase